MQFFGIFSILLFLIALIMFVPVLMIYFRTGLVPNFPTLIVSGFVALAGIISLFTGILLSSIVEKNRQDFEMNLVKVHMLQGLKDKWDC